MQEELRLRRPSEIRRVLAQGRSRAAPLLVVRVAPNDLSQTRFAFVVGKRTGKAVTRNRIKRRLREAARQAPVKGGWDVVVIARAQAASTDYQHLADALETLLHRAQLLKERSQGAARNKAQAS